MQVCPAEVGSRQLPPALVHHLPHHTPLPIQLGLMVQIRPAKVGPPQVSSPQVRAPQIRATQIGLA